MKKVSILLVCILMFMLVGCGNSSNKPVEQKTTETIVKTETPKIYKQGEEAFILDDSGKTMYSIKINSAKVANDFEYKSNFSAAKEIIEVSYTYKNIAKADEAELTIYSSYLQVSDITGATAETTDMYPKQKPQTISVGTNCTVQGYYGLSNISDKVKISFSSADYKKSGILTFEIPVN